MTSQRNGTTRPSLTVVSVRHVGAGRYLLLGIYHANRLWSFYDFPISEQESNGRVLGSRCGEKG